MTLILRLATASVLLSAIASAETWSGKLVDSKCYGALERNVNPTDTSTAVDRDGTLELHYCAPSLKTKLFAVIPEDGRWLRFDSVGNAKAADLVRSIGKKHVIDVAVRGERSRESIKVESITGVPNK